MTERRARPRRRAHPAAGSRILAFGLSASATLGLTGALALSAPATTEPAVKPAAVAHGKPRPATPADRKSQAAKPRPQKPRPNPVTRSHASR